VDGERICPTCGRSNAPVARYCGNCGQILAAAPLVYPAPIPPPSPDEDRAPLRLRRRDRSIAEDSAASVVLSFFFPGVGHVLCGQWRRGLWIILGAFVVVHWLHLAPFGFWMVLARLWVALEAYGLAKKQP
jgi:hypothetical protein